MAITRFDPFREFATLQGQMNRLWQEMTPARSSGEEFMTTGTFIPPVDVYEDEHNVVLKLEVPGMNENDIDVRVENNTLTVRGERKFDKEEKEENFHRIERSYGAFTRSFTLPNTVDTDSVQAEYVNGVLKLRLAKRAGAEPKQMKVNAGSATSGQRTIDAGKGKAA